MTDSQNKSSNKYGDFPFLSDIDHIQTSKYMCLMKNCKTFSECNIAKKGKVAQSSVNKGAGPKRATDGNGASNFELGSCSATKKQQSPWWRLDLLKPYKVGTVAVTIQSDCCHERMNGAEIRIGNSPNSGNANPR